MKQWEYLCPWIFPFLCHIIYFPLEGEFGGGKKDCCVKYHLGIHLIHCILLWWDHWVLAVKGFPVLIEFSSSSYCQFFWSEMVFGGGRGELCKMSLRILPPFSISLSFMVTNGGGLNPPRMRSDGVYGFWG